MPKARPRRFPPQRGPRPRGRRPQRPQPAVAPVEQVAPAVAVIEGRPPVVLPKQVSVRELATLLDVSIVDLMRALVNMGTMASINTTIDFDTASLVATELGIETKAEEEAPPAVEDAEAELAPLKPELERVTFIPFVGRSCPRE